MRTPDRSLNGLPIQSAIQKHCIIESEIKKLQFLILPFYYNAKLYQVQPFRKLFPKPARKNGLFDIMKTDMCANKASTFQTSISASILSTSKPRNSTKVPQFRWKVRRRIQKRVKKEEQTEICSSMDLLYDIRFHAISRYYLKYLARRPSNALPCLASSRAIS
jgi:hypothetical protein